MSVEKRFIPMRWLWLVLLGWAATLSGQPASPQAPLPGTPPTAFGPVSIAPNPGTPPSLGPKPVNRANVTYSDGKLEIAADNSSLNQILREIQRQTGMKIAGGVNEERVFGNYGPGTLAEVLARLLDGTGSNMLLVGADRGSPAELILTPRQGSASPPNPSALAGDAPDATEQPRFLPQRTVPTAIQPDRRSMAPPGVPPPGGADSGVGAGQGLNPALAAPSVVPPADPSGSNGGAPPASPDTTNPQSPNGVKTPQQIYQQLILMQQKMQQQQQPANP